MCHCDYIHTYWMKCKFLLQTVLLTFTRLHFFHIISCQSSWLVIKQSRWQFHSSLDSRQHPFTTGSCGNNESEELLSIDPGRNSKSDSEVPMETSGWDWRRFTRWLTTLHTNSEWNSCYRTVRGIRLNTTHSVWGANQRITKSMLEGIPATSGTSWILAVMFTTGCTSRHTIVTMIAMGAIVPPLMEVDGGTTTAIISTSTARMARLVLPFVLRLTHGSISQLLEWCWRGNNINIRKKFLK